MSEKNRGIKKLLILGLLMLILLWIIFPLYIMIKISLSSPREVMREHPSFFLKSPTIKHWREVLRSRDIKGPFFKSIQVAF